MIDDAFNRDHPRLRGTNDYANAWTIDGRGSPPLARDKYIQIQKEVAFNGITPACAGQIV